MEKSLSLRAYLLAEFAELQQRPETVVLSEDDGNVQVFIGSANDNFRVNYTAVLTIYETTIKTEQLAYVVAQWIKTNHSQHQPGDLTISAEILTDKKADVTFSLPLSETIKVEDVAGGIRLLRSQDKIPKTIGGDFVEFIADDQRD